MTDPMDRPPVDHGADRYDYVEVEGPPGARPIGQWWDDLIAAPCQDCRANVFARYLEDYVGPLALAKPASWAITVAHDERCPTPHLPRGN